MFDAVDAGFLLLESVDATSSVPFSVLLTFGLVFRLGYDFTLYTRFYLESPLDMPCAQQSHLVKITMFDDVFSKNCWINQTFPSFLLEVDFIT